MNPLPSARNPESTNPGWQRFFEGLSPPPGRNSVPRFVTGRGWLVNPPEAAPFLSYLDAEEVNWSPELERLHDHDDHFIDSLTRTVAVGALGLDLLPGQPVVVDLGCSAGRFLRDLQVACPRALAVGVDAVRDGLLTAHGRVPYAPLLHASATDLPMRDGSVDAVAALNLLEHLPDDTLALGEMKRVLRVGGRAVVVIPSNPALYDHYDSYLQHQRRYARGDLAAMAQRVGLRPVRTFYIGSLIYPAFWAVKKFSRWRHQRLSDTRSGELVRRKIRATKSSRLGKLACDVDRWSLERGLRLPFGVREVVVLERS
jgi:ubiquinone/menaquinone biosynthesis C-methylase UbiE